MSRSLWVLVWVSVMLVAGVGADAPTTQPDPRISVLIEQLGDARWSERRAAEAALLEIGEAARPALEAATAHDDAEVRARAINILATLDDRQLVAPTRVTLKLDAVPAVDAVEALGDALGHQFQIWPPHWEQHVGDSTVTVDLQNVTGLEAMRAVLPQCKLAISPHAQGELSIHGQAAWPDVPAFDNGQTRFEVRTLSFNHVRRVDMTTRNVDERASGQMSVWLFAEPKFRMGGPGEMTVDEIIDENGEPIGMNVGGRSSYDHTSLMRQFTLRLDLPVEDRPKTIARMTGHVTVMHIMQTELFTVDQPLEQGGRKIVGNLTLTTEPMVRQSNTLSVEIRVDFPPGRSVERDFLRGLNLVDTEGQRFNRGGYSTRSDQTSLTATVRFSANAADQTPARLEWELPTKQEPREIPFEFTDLPLP
ncbi:MAG: HEAT repeat domain-containing protein [Planctomycetota bacterium]